MLDDDGGGPGTNGSGGLNVLTAALGHDGSPEKAAVNGNVGDGQGDDQRKRAGPQCRHQCNGEQGFWNGQEDIRDAHDDTVDPSAEIAGDGAEETADDGGQADGRKADEQGSP